MKQYTMQRLLLTGLIILLANCSFFAKRQQSKIMQAYNNNPLVYIPLSIFPAYGNTKASIKIDIFFDPWCGPCRKFDAQVVQPLLTDIAYKDKVVVYYHLFPLGNKDNDTEASLLHLEMAKRNLFIPFRTAVEEQHIKKYSDMVALAESLVGEKLPLYLLEKNNQDVLLSEQKTVQSLQLTYTPNIFVNDKSIPIPSLENIKVLIDEIQKSH